MHKTTPIVVYTLKFSLSLLFYFTFHTKGVQLCLANQWEPELHQQVAILMRTSRTGTHSMSQISPVSSTSWTEGEPRSGETTEESEIMNCYTSAMNRRPILVLKNGRAVSLFDTTGPDTKGRPRTRRPGHALPSLASILFTSLSLARKRAQNSPPKIFQTKSYAFPFERKSKGTADLLGGLYLLLGPWWYPSGIHLHQPPSHLRLLACHPIRHLSRHCLPRQALPRLRLRWP